MENQNIANTEITKSVDGLISFFGVDGIMERVFDAIYATVARDVANAKEAEDEEAERWLRGLACEIYGLCEIGKAQITIIEARRRQEALQARNL
ncbi:MAG: hypothetical protein NC344_10095 [Bacteroidales bacterium]|nr:hypothetical protein [Bacteroidales bacterium]MCM1148154.1 hypothetical protein [Bacteroidales bacterium]MCM1207119.1 hypothetical protein [Bacillota bacterium]MCM1510871.1 hypothetical protein [Clostridium sp.]